MNEFILSEKALQETLNYLASKPYVEVQKLIVLLQQAKLVEKPKEKEKE